MATCCISQTGAIFVLLALSKPCIRFWCSLYRFQPKSPHLSSGILGFPCWGQVQSFLVKSCICITYRIPHSIPCLHHVVWALHVVDCVLVACFSCLGRAGETSSLTRSPLSLLSRIQSTLTTLQARWSYPRNHFYLCLLDARSFAMPMLWYLPLAYHASQIAMSNL